MFSISDASDLAKGVYAPTAIALLSLIVIGGFIDIQESFSRLFRVFASTFVGIPKDTPTNTRRTKGQEGLLRVSVLLFLILAWPPFFYSFGNLSPIQLAYSPSTFYFVSNIDALANIACARPIPLSAFEVANYIDGSTLYSESKHFESVSGQVDRAFAMVSISRSIFVLFCLSFVTAIFVKSLRKFTPSLIISGIAVLTYTAASGISAVKTGLQYQASERLAATHASITEENAENLSADCIKKFQEEIGGFDYETVWISFTWPDLGGLLPLTN